MNSVEDNYQHFLSYSGLEDNEWIRYAYFHGADVGVEKPTTLATVTPPRDLRTKLGDA